MTHFDPTDVQALAKIDVPATDATIEVKIAYLRAVAARNDAIASCAGQAFSTQLRRSLRAR